MKKSYLTPNIAFQPLAAAGSITSSCELKTATPHSDYICPVDSGNMLIGNIFSNESSSCRTTPEGAGQKICYTGAVDNNVYNS